MYNRQYSYFSQPLNQFHSCRTCRYTNARINFRKKNESIGMHIENAASLTIIICSSADNRRVQRLTIRSQIIYIRIAYSFYFSSFSSMHQLFEKTRVRLLVYSLQQRYIPSRYKRNTKKKIVKLKLVFNFKVNKGIVKHLYARKHCST